jgi:Domain of unknown function (DUF397)
VSVMDSHGMPVYRISSFSTTGNCVEVALDAVISVRHSTRRDGATLTFTPAEWEAFIQGVKAGEFDLTV